jgi:hypothetical protein
MKLTAFLQLRALETVLESTCEQLKEEKIKQLESTTSSRCLSSESASASKDSVASLSQVQLDQSCCSLPLLQYPASSTVVSIDNDDNSSSGPDKYVSKSTNTHTNTTMNVPSQWLSGLTVFPLPADPLQLLLRQEQCPLEDHQQLVCTQSSRKRKHSQPATEQSSRALGTVV